MAGGGCTSSRCAPSSRAAADDVARAAVTTSARVDGERVGRCTARARERRGRSAARGAREVETRGGGERWRRRLRDARAFESAVTRGRRRDARWRREEARERGVERAARAVAGRAVESRGGRRRCRRRRARLGV